MCSHSVEVTDLEAHANSSLGLTESRLVRNPLHDFPFQPQKRQFSSNRVSYVTATHNRGARVVGDGIHHSRDRASLDEEKIGRTLWCARPRMNICAVNCKLSAEEQ
jgi:hypothetical protein